MKLKFTSTLSVCLMMLFFLFVGTNDSHAVLGVKPAAQESNCVSSLFAPLTVEEIKTLKRKDIEKKLDRKLRLRERMTLRMVKRHAKRMEMIGASDSDCALMEKRARNAFLFGFIGLAAAGIIIGALAISQGSKAVKLAEANPDCVEAERSRKRGRTGIFLGIISIIASIGFVILLFI
ncbi:MAG: hypothetical protein AAFP19_15865 [Bacteroidota bacterium]